MCCRRASGAPHTIRKDANENWSSKGVSGGGGRRWITHGDGRSRGGRSGVEGTERRADGSKGPTVLGGGKINTLCLRVRTAAPRGGVSTTTTTTTTRKTKTRRKRVGTTCETPARVVGCRVRGAERLRAVRVNLKTRWPSESAGATNSRRLRSAHTPRHRRDGRTNETYTYTQQTQPPPPSAGFLPFNLYARAIVYNETRHKQRRGQVDWRQRVYTYTRRLLSCVFVYTHSTCSTFTYKRTYAIAIVLKTPPARCTWSCRTGFFFSTPASLLFNAVI